MFSKDVLIQSSVTGRNTHNAPLDPARRNAILGMCIYMQRLTIHCNGLLNRPALIVCTFAFYDAAADFVMEAFPYEGIEVSDFNQIILAKIKNLRHIEKAKGAVIYERMRPCERPYSPNDILPGTIIVPDN